MNCMGQHASLLLRAAFILHLIRFIFISLVGVPLPDDLTAQWASNIFHKDLIATKVKKNAVTKPMLASTAAPSAQLLPATATVEPAPLVWDGQAPLPDDSNATRTAPPPSSADIPHQTSTGEEIPSAAPFCPPSAVCLLRQFPRSRSHAYKAAPGFEYVLFMQVKYGWLEDGAAAHLSAMSPEYEAIITMVPKMIGYDFSWLREPRLNYLDQEAIEKERVWVMTACAVHYDLDIGLVMRFLGGEYLADWRDVDAIIAKVQPYISKSDCDHIRHLLTEGAPAELVWDEASENKEAFIHRGNDATIVQHWDMVIKTLNKEDRFSHVMTFMRWIVRAAPTARVTPQTMVNANHPTKKPRLCWNGKSKRSPHETTMNEACSTAKEAPITFGYAYMALCIWIWNLRITFPTEELLLATVDFTACFRFPRIHPDLAAAFGFVIGAWFFAANAMVFGSITSATSWEPFRRAIAALSEAYFHRSDLLTQHSDYLDMVQWSSEPTPDVSYVQAVADTQNRGVVDNDGHYKPTPHNIYVDENLLCDLRLRLRQALASAIEASFDVMGRPLLHIRQCAIALDKWTKLVVAHRLVLLGLVFDTRTMTVGITDEYRAEVLHMINSWEGREFFTVHEMELLVGKLGRIGQAFRPIYHLMPHMYASVAYALRENEFYYAATSRRFRQMVRKAKQKHLTQADTREIKFAIQKVAKMKHGSRQTYRIPPSLHEEIRIVRGLLGDASIPLETPLAHIVPRDWTFEAAADACKRGGGGWSTSLSFWWHLTFPKDIQA